VTGVQTCALPILNIQASRDVVIYFRGELIGQPYLTLIEREQTD